MANIELFATHLESTGPALQHNDIDLVIPSICLAQRVISVVHSYATWFSTGRNLGTLDDAPTESVYS